MRRAEGKGILRRFKEILRIFFIRFGVGLRQGALSAIAAFIAFMPTHLIGLQQGFWSAITAIAVAQGQFRDSKTTARRQCIGSAVGGAVGLCLGLAFGDHLPVYAGAVIASVLLCRLLNVADAGQLAGITATIILLVPHAGTMQAMMISRLSEVGWGALMGLAAVWLENRLIHET